MKTILKYLIPAALALVACGKEQPAVDPDSVPVDTVVETPEAFFVEGQASANASNLTRSWEYTNAASGEDVLKFNWSENAYATDGTARFEGYWADNYGRFAGASDGYYHTILNDSQHATYVAQVDGNTNIHVSLPATAWNASKLIVIYSGNNVNHTYWFEDPSHAQVSFIHDRHGLVFTFDGVNKRSFYAPNMDNNEAIYGVATLTSDDITEEGNEAATSVDFNFKHLESVFRVRVKNEYSTSIQLREIRVKAKPKKNNAGTKPFADKLCLTYDNGSFTRSLYEDPDIPGVYLDSDWFAVEPVLTIPAADNDPYDHMSIASGSIETVYLMPLANPDCNLRNWLFTFTVEAVVEGASEEYSVYVDGSDIASGSGKNALEPGYVYTVGLKAVAPGVCEYEIGGQTFRFQRSGHNLTLLPPVDGQYSGDIVIPSMITVGGEAFYIRKIGKMAFAGQPVTSVVFPDYMEFEDTETLFYGCTSLSSVTLPAAGLITIGSQMFALCSSLESLTIPASVTRVDPGPFVACSQLGGQISSLSSSILVDESGMVYSPSGELYWMPENLSGVVSIPDGITRIMSSAIFAPPPQYNLPPSEVSELVIPASVARIDNLNFIFLQNLQKLTVNWTTTDSMPSWYRNGVLVSNENVSGLGEWFLGCPSSITLSVPTGYGWLYTQPWQSFDFNVAERE